MKFVDVAKLELVMVTKRVVGVPVCPASEAEEDTEFKSIEVADGERLEVLDKF